MFDPYILVLVSYSPKLQTKLVILCLIYFISVSDKQPVSMSAKWEKA